MGNNILGQISYFADSFVKKIIWKEGHAESHLLCQLWLGEILLLNMNTFRAAYFYDYMYQPQTWNVPKVRVGGNQK